MAIPCDMCGAWTELARRPVFLQRSTTDASKPPDLNRVCPTCFRWGERALIVLIGWGVLSLAFLAYAGFAHPALEHPLRVLGLMALWFVAPFAFIFGVLNWRTSKRKASPYFGVEYEVLLDAIRAVRDELDAWQSGDHELAELRKKAWLIGAELNRRGGKRLMLTAFKQANANRGIEISWDGVGEWRG